MKIDRHNLSDTEVSQSVFLMALRINFLFFYVFYAKL